MKKVLALVVAFALCFTAFTGCFATSAAALDNFAVSSVEVAADAQAAAVTVSGTYSGKAVQLLTVTLPEGVALDSVEGAKELTDTQDGEYIVTGNVVKFLDVPNNAFTYILKVTFAANTSETDAVAYEVAANVEYALYDAENPTIETANAKGTITVAKKAPSHVCDFDEYTYDVVDGNCVTTVACDCGEVKTYTVANSNITQSPCLNADLSVFFNILTSDVNGYTDLYATFDKEGFDNDADFDTVTKSVVETLSGSSYTRFYYGVDETTEAGNEIGITSKQMVNDIDCRIYGKNADGAVVLIAQETWCMRDYIDEKYPEYSVKTSATYKKLTTLLVDLANYGAQAQKTFEYNVNDLANANIDNTTYATPIRDDFVDNDSWDTVELKTGGDLASKVLLLVNIPKSAVKENYKLKINYINAEKQSDVKTYNAADFADYNSNYYRVKFDGYVAPTLIQPATITLCDAEDNFVGSVSFSFASYAGRLKGYAASNAAYAPSYAAVQYLYAYGTSAAAYFG